MTIQDFLDETLICQMSSGLKNESNYSNTEFKVEIYEDSHSDSEYSATVSGTDVDGTPFSDVWDASTVVENFLFDNWIIKKRL